jgi:magnesium-transporting ATPase (P-type)
MLTVRLAVCAGKPFSQVGISDDVTKIYNEGTSVNSTAEVQPPASGVGVSDHIGSKTECALLQYAMDMGANYTEIRHTEERAHMSPFSSAKKRMSVIVKAGMDIAAFSWLPCLRVLLYYIVGTTGIRMQR